MRSFGSHAMLRALALATLAAGALWSSPSEAAVPGTALIEGALLSSGGSPAADGDYDVTFSVYATESDGTAAWSEGPLKIKVLGGRFTHALGSGKALDAKALEGLAAQWLGVKVASDPELPRKKIHSAIFALHAATAGSITCSGCVGSDHIANGSVAAAKLGFNYAGSSTKGGPAVDLECSGCVSVAEMKFDGDVDLGGNSLKAGNATFTGDLSAKSVTAASFVGDGSKLTGIKSPAGECKTVGQVVKGINADGSLICVAALDPNALPKDGLNEISNDLLSNQFVDTINGASDVKIPDNTGSDAISNMTFPNIGVTQSFELYVEAANTDLSTLKLSVLPPDDKKTGWVLCDPCGKKDEKSYKVTFSVDNKPASGDLAKWVGANAQGLWTLKALDSGYCIPQAPGNSALCDTNGKTDGAIVKWSIKIKTLSNQKVAINGDTYATGTINVGKDLDVKGKLNIGAGAAISGNVDVSASTLGPAVTRDSRKYYVVVPVRDPAFCPKGWNVEMNNTLRGSNNYVYMHITGGGLVLTDNQGNGYGQEHIYAGWNTNSLGGDAGAVCWKAYDSTSGRPHAMVVNYRGGGYTCPAGFHDFKWEHLRGSNSHVYLQANRWGLQLGYVDTWDRASNAHSEDGGSYHRYWQNQDQFAGACLRVYGHSEDPETANGVFPVVLGMHGDTKECPAGWNLSTTQAIGAGNRIYYSAHATATTMGPLYDWGHSNIYRYTHFAPGEVNNVCWKMVPRLGRPSAQVRAPRFVSSCPDGFMTFSRDNIMGWNNHAYFQNGTSGLYFGGLNSWSHNENDGGYSAITFNDTAIQKFCLKLDNAKL